jgi:hypothetical protein
MGINFQCPKAFAQHFVNASQTLGPNVVHPVPDLIRKPQARMHLSLAYFCCIREDEFRWLKQTTMYEWTMEIFPLNVPIAFDEVQCWHEQCNSVTKHILADNDSQVQLIMRAY